MSVPLLSPSGQSTAAAGVDARTVWLVYERSPHPDAVSSPADARDVRLILHLLERTRNERVQIAERLRAILAEIERRSPFERPGIPARTPEGIYRPISWRLAKWLACVLRCDGSVRERVTGRLHAWLSSGSDGEACRPRALERLTPIARA